jgi:hypothetical protein
MDVQMKITQKIVLPVVVVNVVLLFFHFFLYKVQRVEFHPELF